MAYPSEIIFCPDDIILNNKKKNFFFFQVDIF